MRSAMFMQWVVHHITALSLVGFPNGALPPEVLAEILRGAAEKAQEAGIAIVGGHTIQTDEPIFGLAVVGTGTARMPSSRTRGARPGDLLVLTKPLGLGIITTAAKRNEDDQEAISEAIAVMTTLNRDSSAMLVQAGAHALTDVTGFGLLGIFEAWQPPAESRRRSGPIWFRSCPQPEDYVQKGIVPWRQPCQSRVPLELGRLRSGHHRQRAALALRRSNLRRFASRFTGRLCFGGRERAPVCGVQLRYADRLS